MSPSDTSLPDDSAIISAAKNTDSAQTESDILDMPEKITGSTAENAPKLASSSSSSITCKIDNSEISVNQNQLSSDSALNLKEQDSWVQSCSSSAGIKILETNQNNSITVQSDCNTQPIIERSSCDRQQPSKAHNDILSEEAPQFATSQETSAEFDKQQDLQQYQCNEQTQQTNQQQSESESQITKQIDNNMDDHQQNQNQNQSNSDGGPVTTGVNDMDRFPVVKALGRGAFGKVDLISNGRESFALKHYHFDDLQNKKHRGLALEEGHILQKLQHPNIVRCHWVHVTDFTIYLLLQYIDGGDLNHYIIQRKSSKRRKMISQRLIGSWFQQLLEALAHIHGLAILHRDIKPSNILVSSDHQKVYLADFGVCRMLRSTRGLANTNVGSPVYAAPEVWSGKSYSNKVDIFSLGCCVFEMCTFKPPFNGRNLVEICRQVYRGPPKVKGTYPALGVLVSSMLSANPSHRPSAKHLLEKHLADIKTSDTQAQHGLNLQDQTASQSAFGRSKYPVSRRMPIVVTQQPNSKKASMSSHDKSVSTEGNGNFNNQAVGAVVKLDSDANSNFTNGLHPSPVEDSNNHVFNVNQATNDCNQQQTEFTSQAQTAQDDILNSSVQLPCRDILNLEQGVESRDLIENYDNKNDDSKIEQQQLSGYQYPEECSNTDQVTSESGITLQSVAKINSSAQIQPCNMPANCNQQLVVPQPVIQTTTNQKGQSQQQHQQGQQQLVLSPRSELAAIYSKKPRTKSGNSNTCQNGQAGNHRHRKHQGSQSARGSISGSSASNKQAQASQVWQQQQNQQLPDSVRASQNCNNIGNNVGNVNSNPNINLDDPSSIPVNEKFDTDHQRRYQRMFRFIEEDEQEQRQNQIQNPLYEEFLKNRAGDSENAKDSYEDRVLSSSPDQSPRTQGNNNIQNKRKNAANGGPNIAQVSTQRNISKNMRTIGGNATTCSAIPEENSNAATTLVHVPCEFMVSTPKTICDDSESDLQLIHLPDIGCSRSHIESRVPTPIAAARLPTNLNNHGEMPVGTSGGSEYVTVNSNTRTGKQQLNSQSDTNLSNGQNKNDSSHATMAHQGIEVQHQNNQTENGAASFYDRTSPRIFVPEGHGISAGGNGFLGMLDEVQQSMLRSRNSNYDINPEFGSTANAVRGGGAHQTLQHNNDTHPNQYSLRDGMNLYSSLGLNNASDRNIQAQGAIICAEPGEDQQIQRDIARQELMSGSYILPDIKSSNNPKNLNYINNRSMVLNAGTGLLGQSGSTIGPYQSYSKRKISEFYGSESSQCIELPVINTQSEFTNFGASAPGTLNMARYSGLDVLTGSGQYSQQH